MISVDATATGITIAIAGHAPGIIAKATIVLAVCGCIAASTTRASAARRHLLWLCALVSCGALALLAPISKRIVVPMPAFVAAHASSGRAGGRDRHDVSIAGDESSHSAPVDVTPGRQDPSQNWKPLAPARWLPAALPTIGFIVWLAGVLFVTLRFAFAYRSVNAVVRRLSERGGSRWQASLARLADRRDIRVRVGGDLSSPFTIGFARPTIVLPADADDWSDERRDAVLRHEIAHIERGDLAAQTIGLLVCALFWFHPLAWFALGQLRHESERAADDRVIGAGLSSMAYAAHLVEIARGVSSGRSVPLIAVAIAMPPLERRIRAILDRGRSRGGVALRTRIVGMCTALAAMGPMSGIELGEGVQPKPVTAAHRAADPIAATSVNVPRKAGARAIKSKNAQPLPVRRHAVVVATTDSAGAETASPARPFHIGGHPDFSGVWSLADRPPADSDTTAVTPTLAIAQTPTTITETVRRRVTDEFGRNKGVLDATLQLEDGAPAQATFAVNGRAVRPGLFAMSWDDDTLMVRTAQVGRHSISGAVERFWLTADGRGLVTHSVPFGYIVNEARTDTIWRTR